MNNLKSNLIDFAIDKAANRIPLLKGSVGQKIKDKVNQWTTTTSDSHLRSENDLPKNKWENSSSTIENNRRTKSCENLNTYHYNETKQVTLSHETRSINCLVDENFKEDGISDKFNTELDNESASVQKYPDRGVRYEGTTQVNCELLNNFHSKELK